MVESNRDHNFAGHHTVVDYGLIWSNPKNFVRKTWKRKTERENLREPLLCYRSVGRGLTSSRLSLTKRIIYHWLSLHQ